MRSVNSSLPILMLFLAVVLVYGIFLATMNLAVDLVYGLIDPRIRY